MVLQNETSLKIAKKVSWKYHNFMEMHHKNANKKQKKILEAEKIHRFQAINTLFSRYNRNFSLKTQPIWMKRNF